VALVGVALLCVSGIVSALYLLAEAAIKRLFERK